jgi:hypothetical protein
MVVPCQKFASTPCWFLYVCELVQYKHWVAFWGFVDSATFHKKEVPWIRSYCSGMQGGIHGLRSVKRKLLALEPARCQIRDETSTLKTEDMIMCCLVKVIARLSADLWVLSNDRRMIKMGISQKLGENLLPCQFIQVLTLVSAERSPFKQWDRGFESHLRHWCLSAFIMCLCCPA